MRKPGLAVAILVACSMLTGCVSNSTLLESRPTLNPPKSEEREDAEFLRAIESTGSRNPEISDEVYIRYGRTICTLLDEAPDPEDIVISYRGEDQAISDAAIQIYCPKYAEDI